MIHVYEFKSKNKLFMYDNIFLFLSEITNIDVCQVQRRISITL